jgi:drug/metabolite transporter (DMT)-like permease
MGQYSWFLAAVTAAMMWGASYALMEKVLRLGISPAAMLVFNGVFAMVIYGAVMWVQGGHTTAIKLLQAHPYAAALLLAVVAMNVTGNFLIFFSISEKNATLASLIEISYPLFTALFAWLFFKQVQMNWIVGAGAGLIFAGIVLVMFGASKMTPTTAKDLATHESTQPPPPVLP